MNVILCFILVLNFVLRIKERTCVSMYKNRVLRRKFESNKQETTGALKI
jgi:hypothetical protein